MAKKFSTKNVEKNERKDNFYPQNVEKKRRNTALKRTFPQG
jgi:hypothetical protein